MINFIIGLCVGVFLGILIIALCSANNYEKNEVK